MAENEKKTKERKKWSSTKILDCVAYFAIAFIAIALILKLGLKGHADQISNAFGAIGECLAYVICVWLAFYWTMRKISGGINKHNVWWLVGWLVATIVIIIVYIFAY